MFGLALAYAFLMPMFFSVNAQAAALPPRVKLESWSSTERLKNISVRKAVTIEYVTKSPVVHGKFVYQAQNQRLLVLSSDATRVEEYKKNSQGTFLKTREFPIENSKQLETLFSVKNEKSLKTYPHEQGVFDWSEFAATFLGYRESFFSKQKLWSLDMGFKPDAVESFSQTKSIFAWGAYPQSKLYVVPASLSLSYNFDWLEDSEPVRLFTCSQLNSVLAENTSEGLSRFVFFKNHSEPTFYTVFDFVSGAGRSDMTHALSLGTECDHFLISGAFGIVEVRYARGAM